MRTVTPREKKSHGGSITVGPSPTLVAEDLCGGMRRNEKKMFPRVAVGSPPLLSLFSSYRAGSESAFSPSLSLSLSFVLVATEMLEDLEPRVPESCRSISRVSRVRAASCERPRVYPRGSSLSAARIHVSEMTSSALFPRWIVVSLALVLVCQTARRIEGYPHTSSTSSNAFTEMSTSEDSTSISKLIETAYKNHELLTPREWSQQTDGHDDQQVQQTQGDTDISGQQKSSTSDGMMQFRKRQLLQVSSTTTSKHRGVDASLHRNSDEKIIFPDGKIPSTSPQTISPPVCRKTFCENVTDYPRQLVDAALARNVSLRFLESVEITDIEQRIDVTDELTLCQYREQVVYPQTAQNKEKQWLFIVNQDNLKQGIRIEVCLNDGQTCNMIDGFAEGYKTTCKQKFIYRELAAVGSDGNIIKDQFRFPSSCCCHVKFIGDPTVRLGLDLPANRTSTFSTFSSTIP